ncbi:MAG: hypothetical protein ACN6PV_02155 [Achromobacter sp.]|uniref:hypothetical protein n=1 Tax=Achromobacter sp. TaxID=134375 RepID=UPI003CFE9B67
MKVIDRGLQRYAAEMRQLGTVAVKVGIQAEDANTPGSNGTALIDYVEFNEYGTEKIPSRPLHRDAARVYEKQLADVQEQQVAAIVSGKKTATEAVHAVGAWYQGIVQHHLINGPWEPNATSTVKRKGLKQPLIDEKLHFNSIKYKVVKA